MSTKYKVLNAHGDLLGIFPKGDMAGLKAFVSDKPGAQIKPIVTADDRCPWHAAYEADNCLACGTSPQVR